MVGNVLPSIPCSSICLSVRLAHNIEQYQLSNHLKYLSTFKSMSIYYYCTASSLTSCSHDSPIKKDPLADVDTISWLFGGLLGSSAHDIRLAL